MNSLKRHSLLLLFLHCDAIGQKNCSIYEDNTYCLYWLPYKSHFSISCTCLRTSCEARSSEVFKQSQGTQHNLAHPWLLATKQKWTGRLTYMSDTKFYTSLPSGHTFSRTSQLLRVSHFCIIVYRIFGGRSIIPRKGNSDSPHHRSDFENISPQWWSRGKCGSFSQSGKTTN